MPCLLALVLCSAPGLAPEPRAEKIQGEISITSSSPQALAKYLAGRDAMDAQRQDDARAAFERAVALDPKCARSSCRCSPLLP